MMSAGRRKRIAVSRTKGAKPPDGPDRTARGAPGDRVLEGAGIAFLPAIPGGNCPAKFRTEEDPDPAKPCTSKCPSIPQARWLITAPRGDAPVQESAQLDEKEILKRV